MLGLERRELEVERLPVGVEDQCSDNVLPRRERDAMRDLVAQCRARRGGPRPVDARPREQLGEGHVGRRSNSSLRRAAARDEPPQKRRISHSADGAQSNQLSSLSWQ